MQTSPEEASANGQNRRQLRQEQGNSTTKSKTRPSTMTTSQSQLAFSPRGTRDFNYRYNTTFSFQQKIKDQEVYNKKIIYTQEKDIEIERLKTTCFTLNKSAILVKDLEVEIQSLKKRLQDQQNANQLQGEEIEQYEENRLTYEKTRKSQEKVISEYEKKRLQQENNISDLRLKQEKEISDLKTQHEKVISDYEKRRLQQEDVIAEYESIRIAHKRDNKALKQENNSLRADLENTMEAKTKMQVELQQVNDYVLQMEEKMYKSEKINLELMKQLKDAEVEITCLEEKIASMQFRIYFPIRSDPIDCKVAEYLNHHSDRAKFRIMFKREIGCSGIYYFGTKKIQIAQHRELLKVRVGGGYIDIDEFVDKYTQVEIDKLDRSSPVRRLTGASSPTQKASQRQKQQDTSNHSPDQRSFKF